MWLSKVLRRPASCGLTRVFEMKSAETVTILDRQFDFRRSNPLAPSSLSQAAIFLLPGRFPLIGRADRRGARRDWGPGGGAAVLPGWGGRAVGGGPRQRWRSGARPDLHKSRWGTAWPVRGLPGRRGPRPGLFFRPLRMTYGDCATALPARFLSAHPRHVGSLRPPVPQPHPGRMEGRFNIPVCVRAGGKVAALAAGFVQLPPLRPCTLPTQAWLQPRGPLRQSMWTGVGLLFIATTVSLV